MRIMGRLTAWAAVLGMPAVAWALARTAWMLWDGRKAPARVDDLAAMGAAGIGAAVAGYLAMTGWAMLLGALVRSGRTVPHFVAALAPVSWQRVTATALGMTISAGLASPALASQPSAPHVGWGESVAGQTASPAQVPAVGSPAGWASPVAIATPPADGGALAVGFAPAPSEQCPTGRHRAPCRTAPVAWHRRQRPRSPAPTPWSAATRSGASPPHCWGRGRAMSPSTGPGPSCTPRTPTPSAPTQPSSTQALF